MNRIGTPGSKAIRVQARKRARGGWMAHSIGQPVVGAFGNDEQTARAALQLVMERWAALRPSER